MERLDLGPVEPTPLVALQIDGPSCAKGDPLVLEKLALLRTGVRVATRADPPLRIDDPVPRYVFILGNLVQRPANRAGGLRIADDGCDLAICSDLAVWDQAHDVVNTCKEARTVLTVGHETLCSPIDPLSSWTL